MKTKLPAEVKAIDSAKALLTDLHNNSEAYHPEDDANDCLEGIATKSEGDLLNKLMNDIYSLEGNNDYLNMAFDPCNFLLWLNMPKTVSLVDLTTFGNYEYIIKSEDQIVVSGWTYTKSSSTDYSKNSFESAIN